MSSAFQEKGKTEKYNVNRKPSVLMIENDIFFTIQSKQTVNEIFPVTVTGGKRRTKRRRRSISTKAKINVRSRRRR
jgi:hypothetical protein